MSKYIVSPAAQRSLRDIRIYSLDKFGKARTNKYLKAIRDHFESLAENPDLSKIRDEVNVGYRSAFVGSHTIYFLLKNDHIEIIDVLHQSMKPSLHLLH